MNVYRCEAGHLTRRLTECRGFRHEVLHIHVPPDDPRRVHCDCKAPAAAEIACPETIGVPAPDALTIPPMCGRPAVLVSKWCIICGHVYTKDYCDDCWSALQGGCTD